MKLIDADALKIALDDDWVPDISVSELWQIVDTQPTIDAAPVVHGRWVYEHGDPAMIPCSMCGYRVFRYNNTRYCPNCGAKMDDDENRDCESAVEMQQYCEKYESTYSTEDGSM